RHDRNSWNHTEWHATAERKSTCPCRSGVGRRDAGNPPAARTGQRNKTNAGGQSRTDRERSKANCDTDRYADSNRKGKQSGSYVIDTAIAKVYGIQSDAESA